MRCDVIAKGIIDAAAQLEMKIPIVVRLQGKQLKIFTSYDSITIETVFDWFKQKMNQSVGSFSANPHFALLWSDERSDPLGNVSDHWGMVTYNFFRNNFLGH